MLKKCFFLNILHYRSLFIPRVANVKWGHISNRLYSTYASDSTEPYFISTPIFYVNDVPHIGHLHTAVLADTVARWQRMKGRSVLYSTGTDEHGLKIQKSAKAAKQSPQTHCDNISSEFRRLFKLAHIDNTDFIRTTEDRHIAVVQQLWKKLSYAGHIYSGFYSGWYCVSDEAFLKDNEIREQPNDPERCMDPVRVSIESGHVVEWLEEENYMFRLTNFKDDLLYWLRHDVIKPAKFHTIVVRMVEEIDSDLSISRSRSRLSWGIPVPGDESQTIYVWLDALVNYLTVSGYPNTGYTWPANCHVVGKDILKFHAIYWPAFLIGAGLSPPGEIACHSHWLVDGVKMSKSLGNVVDPFSSLETYTVDGLRYFLMREATPHSDANFTHKKVVNVVNSELANTLGNLLNRCLSITVNPDQWFPVFNPTLFSHTVSEDDINMWHKLRDLAAIVDGYYTKYEIYKGLEAIMTQLHQTNVFLDRHKPWELRKHADQRELLDNTLHVVMETLRISAILLCPVIPNISGRILDQLSITRDRRMYADCMEVFQGGVKLNKSFTGPAFKRLQHKSDS